MLSDYEAMQKAIARDGASVISGGTEDLKAVRRCDRLPFTPDNLIAVTLEESWRINGDRALKRIGIERGWFVHAHDNPEMIPVKYPDGKFYRLDKFGGRFEIDVKRGAE